MNTHFTKFFGIEFFRAPLLKSLKNNALQNAILRVFHLVDNQIVMYVIFNMLIINVLMCMVVFGS